MSKRMSVVYCLLPPPLVVFIYPLLVGGVALCLFGVIVQILVDPLC
jgi:hypothetical protein